MTKTNRKSNKETDRNRNRPERAKTVCYNNFYIKKTTFKPKTIQLREGHKRTKTSYIII